MDAYGQDILHYIRFYTKTHTEAEDLTQEVFLRAYKSRQTFRGDSQLKTWLLRIAIHICHDHARRQKRRPLQYVADISALSDRHVTTEETTHVQPSAEQEVLRNISNNELIAGVLSLPEKYRTVLLLHYFEELSIAEIAQIVHISESAVKSRLFRARQSLKQLDSRGGGEADAGR